MTTFLYLTVNTVHLLLLVIRLCMFARAILSLFPMNDGPITAILLFITEPVIYPVRRLCEKFGLGDGMILDIPFFITFVLITFLSMIL